MKNNIIIDGFEFEPLYSSVSDVENLNYFLEKMFNKFDIKDYISRRHPELFPHHIGLRCDDGMTLSIVCWEKNTLDACGEYDHGWRAFEVNDPEKYKQDILDYFKLNDTGFYNFIINHLK
jgi:hypothetical protein